MAVAWQRKIGDIRYEVRTAGRSIRLYTGGAFHSQYNPAHLFTGAVWDLLSLPSLCADTKTRHVLALGVGGGTVIHQLHRLHPLKSVTGIELDPTHIEIAKRFFNLNYAHTVLVDADARYWLETSRARFDYIIDDVFLHGEADPARPFFPDDSWCSLLKQHLKPGGAVVQNHIDDKHAAAGRKTFRRYFDRVLTFENDMYANTVVAGYLSDARPAELRQRVADRLALLPSAETRRLRHRIR